MAHSLLAKVDEPLGESTMSCGCSRQPTSLLDQREGGDAVMEASALDGTYSCGRSSNISRAPLETLPAPVKPNTMGQMAGGRPLAEMNEDMSRTMSLALATDGTMKEEGTLRKGVEYPGCYVTNESVTLRMKVAAAAAVPWDSKRSPIPRSMLNMPARRR